MRGWLRRLNTVMDITFGCDEHGNCRFSTSEIKGVRGRDPQNPGKVNLLKKYREEVK